MSLAECTNQRRVEAVCYDNDACTMIYLKALRSGGGSWGGGPEVRTASLEQ